MGEVRTGNGGCWAGAEDGLFPFLKKSVIPAFREAHARIDTRIDLDGRMDEQTDTCYLNRKVDTEVYR